MRKVAVIKDRLAQNARRIQILKGSNTVLSRRQEIELEYLQLEARAFERILSKLQKKWWTRLLPAKKSMLVMAILTMSIYVLTIFQVFKELDLSKVEQWEFAVTAMPFWMIIALVPLAIITLFTSWKTRL